MRHVHRIAVCAAAYLLVCAGSAQATPATYNFSGAVTQVSPGTPAEILVGAPITGYFTVDTDVVLGHTDYHDIGFPPEHIGFFSEYSFFTGGMGLATGSRAWNLAGDGDLEVWLSNGLSDPTDAAFIFWNGATPPRINLFLNSAIDVFHSTDEFPTDFSPFAASSFGSLEDTNLSFDFSVTAIRSPVSEPNSALLALAALGIALGLRSISLKASRPA